MSNMGKGAVYYLTRSKSLLIDTAIVVLKCGIFMKTNNVWVLLLFSPVSIIVLTACGLCLMTKERIVSSYY